MAKKEHTAMKAYASILLVTVLLTGCGQNTSIIPTVHAAPPAAAAYINGCPDSPGNVHEAIEHPGSQIELLDTACSLEAAQGVTATNFQSLHNCGRDQVVEITTTADFHVHAIRLWMGADMNALFENGLCLEIIPPGGAGYRKFTAEWDKHVEEHYPDTPFPVDFIVPAGSLVRLSRDPHGTIKCADTLANGQAAGCLTQEGAALY